MEANMAAERFKWLGAATFSRSRGGVEGKSLEPQHIYNMADFDPNVVAEWIRTGHAEAVEGTPIDTRLKVENATVSVKAPKIGAGK
jgi:hypothetical protein